MSWVYRPIENPDWGYARNLQTAIKTSRGTWSQSIFSVKCNGFLAPNRDYPHQGLTAMIDGESWKFLDAVFFKLLEGERALELISKEVTINPWKVTYNYSTDDTRVSVSYYLFEEEGEDGLSAKVDFKMSKPLRILVRPLVDVRPVNDQSGWQETTIGNDHIIITSREKSVMMKFNGKASFVGEPITWWYKLGSGFRGETKDGVKFIGETRTPLFAGEFVGEGTELTLMIACDKNNRVEQRMKRTVEMKEKMHRLPSAPVKLKDTKLTNVLRARLDCLRRFDVKINSMRIPTAGDFWFKKIYFRDVFEGLYNNLHLLIRENGKKYIKNILRLAFSLQDRTSGRVPNFYPNDYNGCDATTLCFVVAGEYVKSTKDKSFARKALKHLELTVKAFSKNKPVLNGPPVLDESKLLLCVPWHSWTDARVSVNVMGENIPLIPIRIPFEWKETFYKNGMNVYRECNSPLYLLPEINAQWIKLLEAGSIMSKVLGERDKRRFFIEMEGEAYNSFLKMFWKNNFILNLIRKKDGGVLKDSTLTSMGLVSAVLLSELLGRAKLKRMEKGVKKLMIHRKGKLFGVLVKDSEKRLYLNDEQYQEATVWPRDVPYLVRYLILIGKKELAQELLENHLDHQMNEGVIFYNHELFSLPEGKNPCREGTKEPVPVKNPAQYWSQFVEPFTWAFS